MKKKLLYCTLACFVAFFTYASATASEVSFAAEQQNKTAKGIVKDVNGEPVIGATVAVQGTSRGASTDVLGNFEIQNLAVGSVIKISLIGYKTVSIPFTGSDINVTMEEDVLQISEVVVVGYGQQAKINLTGSVSSISNKDLSNRPITSLSSALQGLSAGVQVTSGQGRPGQDGATILVRGRGTINNSSPYILIDGVESGSMNQIDPNDVETISVLKDAASSAIYGSKAANGVILVTTKRGQSGKPKLSYHGYVGWSEATELVERMSSYDYGVLYNNILLSNSETAKPKFNSEQLEYLKNGSKPYEYPNTNWADLIFQTGFQTQHNVNINGGNEHVKYMTSLGYLKQEGILNNSGREQFNLRTNLDIILSEKFTVRTNLSFINNNYWDPNSSYAGGSSDQLLRQINRVAPWIVGKYEDGTYGTISDGSPLAWAESGSTIDRYNTNIVGTGALDYSIIDGLKLTLTGTYVSNHQRYTAFNKDIQFNPNKYQGPNSLDERNYEWNRTSSDALLNYDKQFGNHNLKALAGFHTDAYYYKETLAYRTGFPNNSMTDINAGQASTMTNSGYSRELKMVSYFGRINYDYKGIYLFEANFRADAASRFAPENRWGYFPSLSAGWRVAEESFMEGSRNWLNNLKIRGSWGQLGNQDALGGYYPWMQTYAIGNNYVFNGSLNTGIYQGSYNKYDITWETTTTWGIGADMSFLNNFNLTVDYYNRLTDNMLLQVPVPTTFGLGAYTDNVGSIRNSGIEVTLGYNKTFGDLRLGVSANYSYNHNEVLDINAPKRDTYLDGSANAVHKVGSAFDTYYVYEVDGIFQTQQEADAWSAKYNGGKTTLFGKTLKAGDFRYNDTNGRDADNNLTGIADGKFNADDRIMYKSTRPKHVVGMSLNLDYKGFDFSTLINGAFDVATWITDEVYGTFNGDTGHPSTAWADAWSETNKGGTFPRIQLSSETPSMSAVAPSTFWVFNTDYVRFKNIQLGYTFPAKWMEGTGISRLRLYCSAENLFTIYNLPFNYDPESPAGRGSHYPLLRTTTIGVNVTF